MRGERPGVKHFSSSLEWIAFPGTTAARSYQLPGQSKGLVGVCSNKTFAEQRQALVTILHLFQMCGVFEVFLRSHLGTLALKTEDFSKKIGRFSKAQKMDLLTPSLGQKTLEKQGEERFSKSIFAFY